MIPGGGVENNESDEECCIREIAEETGIEVEPLACLLEIDEYYENCKWVNKYFICKAVGTTQIKQTEEEKQVGMEPRWLQISEIKDIFSKHNLYKGIDEMRRGMYLREYIALSELQEKYLANPKSGSCPCFKAGDTFLLKRTPERDDFYHLMNGKFCGEAWDAISRYVYTALQGGSIMHKWTNDERMMITCCNDGTRPVIFKIERIDIPENDEERQWLEKQDFRNTVEDAYTG